MYQLSTWLPLQPLKIFCGICWLAFSFITIIQEYKFQKKTKKLLILNDKWIYFPGLGIYCQYLIYSSHTNDNTWFSVLITLSIIFQLAYMRVHKKVKSKAFQLYPEAFITA
jgi:succinate-acetate transporter protein